MKQSLRALALLLAALPAAAISLPMRIPFQGKLIDPATNNPKNGTMTMTFSIYSAPSGGSALFTETQSVTVVNGAFAVQIGTSTPLSEDLFSGASAYLGVTVSPDAEMTPRQPLSMSPYSFTAAQLVQDGDIRINAGPTYSTFTAAGNLILPYGITSSTRVYSGLATEPPATAGMMYYNTSSGTIKISDGTEWRYVYGATLERQYAVTTDNTAAVAVSKAANATILVIPLFIPGPMMVNRMVVQVTTALGAAGDIGIYDVAGNLILNGGSSSLTTTAALKSITPVQTGAARFLSPGQYYAAVTFNSTTGRLAGNTLLSAGMINRVGTVLGGGLILPASINPAAITAGTIMTFFQVNP
jgi:hypothetical protein